jgi:hypothetical protein
MDYYVDAAQPGANGMRRWIVRGSDEDERLGLLSDLRRALDLAISYARSRIEFGLPSQVHCRMDADHAWFTAWCAPGESPRYRERGSIGASVVGVTATQAHMSFDADRYAVSAST